MVPIISRFLPGRSSTLEIFTPYFSTVSRSRFSVHSVTRHPTSVGSILYPHVA